MKRTTQVTGAALVALLAPLALAGQTLPRPTGESDYAPAASLTLEEALTLARRTNPVLRAARASVRLPEAELAQAYRFSNPVLGFAVLPGLNAGTGLAVSLAKRFEIAGQRGLRAEGSRARIDAATWEAGDVERRLRLQVANSFYAVRVTQELTQLIDSVVVVTARLLEAAELKFQAGLAPELDRNIARIQLLQARVQRVQVLRELAVRKNEVNALTGRPPESDFTAIGPLVHGPVPEQFAVSELQAYALRNRTDALAIASRRRAVSASIRLARRLAMPDLVLGLGINREADGPQTIGLSAGISLPVFDRNQYGQDLAQAASEIVAAQGEARSRAISQEVRSALVRLETMRAQLAAYEEDILELADANQRFAADAYARGELDITTAVLAARQHTEAHVGFLEAVLAFDQAAAELESAVGAPLTNWTTRRQEENGS